MNQIQKNKFKFLIGGMVALGMVVALITYALRQNISLYYTPAQIIAKQAPKNTLIRAGGMVVSNSIERSKKSLQVSFRLTDYQQTMQVHYQGILPDLFRDGQGVVVRGYVNNQNVFEAQEVLAKHDENYMPPEVRKSLQGNKP